MSLQARDADWAQLPCQAPSCRKEVYWHRDSHTVDVCSAKCALEVIVLELDQQAAAHLSDFVRHQREAQNKMMFSNRARAVR